MSRAGLCCACKKCRDHVNEFIFCSGHRIKRNARGNSKRPALGRETKKGETAMRTTLCSSFTRCLTSKWFVLFALALLAVAFLPTWAFAQGTCLQDEFNKFNGDTSTTCAASPSSVALGCSANDVSVSTVAPSSVHNITNPNLGSSCFQNLPFDFVAEFEV